MTEAVVRDEEGRVMEVRRKDVGIMFQRPSVSFSVRSHPFLGRQSVGTHFLLSKFSGGQYDGWIC